jgi:hypothetical protein
LSIDFFWIPSYHPHPLSQKTGRPGGSRKIFENKAFSNWQMAIGQTKECSSFLLFRSRRSRAITAMSAIPLKSFWIGILEGNSSEMMSQYPGKPHFHWVFSSWIAQTREILGSDWDTPL